MYKISSSYASVLINTLSAQGLDLERLRQEAGLEIKLVDLSEAFCERSTIYSLWDLAALVSGDPNIGLKAYENFNPGIFQIVGYTMMSSLNLKKAFEQLIHFSPLIGTGFNLFFVQAPGVRIVVASPVFPKKAYRGRKETGRAVLFT